MAQETLRENKMGTMPENRLLLSMAVPMMISMLVQALYNIVDSIFVSRICEDALTAVSMAFPLQNIIISIAVGFGVGINALLSRALGQKNAERVNQVAVNGLLLALLALLVLDVSVGAQFPVPWGEPLTLRGAASFCLDFAPRPEVVDGIWQRPEWPWKTLPASDSAGAGGDCSLSG